ncbi:hypothetical protein [Kaarinaea lacus]
MDIFYIKYPQNQLVISPDWAASKSSDGSRDMSGAAMKMIPDLRLIKIYEKIEISRYQLRIKEI